MNITDGNISYGNLHVPFFWRVSNRMELNNILVDVREGGRGRGEGRDSSLSCTVCLSSGSEKLQRTC